MGWINLDIMSDSQLPNNDFLLTLIRAGEVAYGDRDALPFEGWVSRTYGEKNPALSLAFEVQSEGTTHFRTEFIFPHES